ncbi:MAG: tetratricopeptide repeat protein [Dysgonamonadaceae bacterium]|jgi:tetratricopeptide (TPR) repeat protein|nr:tetratricopeptide repeat protein [Dysgonamonadaceae bacterium]
MKIRKILALFLLAAGIATQAPAQINTDKVLAVGRNALYFEDYILSIQYFNQVIAAKPNLAEPYLYRALAKLNLDDYSGAEKDLTACLEINPFLVRAYLLRGIANQYMGNYKAAIDDYNHGLEEMPEDKQMLINKGIAYVQEKDFDSAIATMNQLIDYQPNYMQAYLTRGAIYVDKGDTVKAFEDFDKALKMDKFNASTYAQRGMLYYNQAKYREALADYDEAIRLLPKQVGFYINRGLIRYSLNDLRGAMSDYDAVMILDPKNTIAHYNRGLLRAQIGDVYKSIEDFNEVIKNEPDNFMAIYNRALLNEEARRYQESLADINTVLEEYPYFISGYMLRSEVKRKSGDAKGGDKDYWYAYELEQKLKKERQSGKVVTGKGIFDKNPDDEAVTAENDEKNTREKSDKNIEKFNRLMVYDKEEESSASYNSEIKGRVQDKQVKVELRPQFVVTYYEKSDEIDRTAARYSRLLADYNAKRAMKMQLKITEDEAALSDRQIEYHFKSIDDYSLVLERDSNNLDARFGRAMDYMVVQNLQEAVQDLNRLLAAHPDFALARFNRAVINYKLLEIERYNQSPSKEVSDLSLNIQTGMNRTAIARQAATAKNPDSEPRAGGYLFDLILSDYEKIIEQNPDFVFAWFNRGNIFCTQKDYQQAIRDYDEAISRNPDFAEAWYNRGLTRLYTGDAKNGIEDLSRAGELGIPEAYSIIKKMTAN